MFTTILFEKALEKTGIVRKLNPAIITGAFIDSRSCCQGSVFFAFKGEKIDGHEFIPDLLRKGVWCVGDKGDIDNDMYLQVPDVAKYMRLLANERRRLFKGSVLAITGSSGKTSTRQITVSMLQLLTKTVHATTGNLNNHIGLPLVILNMPMNMDYLVLEMGMNHGGEIENLVKIAQPDFTLITNIGSAHIGNFKSQDELAEAKLEIFNNSSGVAVADIGNHYIESWVSKNMGKRKIAVYSVKDSYYLMERFDELPKYMVENLYCASRLILSAEHILPDFKKTIENCRFQKMRGEEKSFGKRTFVVDCYNANPESMKKSIDNFYNKYSKENSRKMYLILGSMFELGDFSKKMHRELVNYLKTLNLLERVFLIGCEFEKIRPEFLNEKKVLFIGDIAEILQSLPSEGIFLLKGSRGNKLERLIEFLETSGGGN